MGRHGEALLPELFQHRELLGLFRFRCIRIAEDLLRVPIGQHQVPAGLHVQRVVFLLHLIFHLLILEGELPQPDVLRLLDDQVLNGAELLLPGQRQVLPRLVRVIGIHRVLHLVPDFVALRHLRQLRQRIHDGVHLFLDRLLQISIDLLAIHIFQRPHQRPRPLFDLRAVAEGRAHLPDETCHGALRRPADLLVGEILLLVQRQQFVLEDLMGELGPDLLDAGLREIPLLRIVRPHHQVDVGMVFLIVEGRPPANVVG